MSRLKFYLFLFGRCGIGRDRRGLVRLRTVCGLLLFGRLYDRQVRQVWPGWYVRKVQ